MGTFDAAGFAKALENDAVKLAATGQEPCTPFPDGKYTADTPNAPLPCPFCGGKAHLDDDYPGGSYNSFWRVGCQDCGFYMDHGNTQAEAITAWNRRA